MSKKEEGEKEGDLDREKGKGDGSEVRDWREPKKPKEPKSKLPSLPAQSGPDLKTGKWYL
jgi:hypothetical protein